MFDEDRPSSVVHEEDELSDRPAPGHESDSGLEADQPHTQESDISQEQESLPTKEEVMQDTMIDIAIKNETEYQGQLAKTIGFRITPNFDENLDKPVVEQPLKEDWDGHQAVIFQIPVTHTDEFGDNRRLYLLATKDGWKGISSSDNQAPKLNSEFRRAWFSTEMSGGARYIPPSKFHKEMIMITPIYAALKTEHKSNPNNQSSVGRLIDISDEEADKYTDEILRLAEKQKKEREEEERRKIQQAEQFISEQRKSLEEQRRLEDEEKRKQIESLKTIGSKFKSPSTDS